LLIYVYAAVEKYTIFLSFLFSRYGSHRDIFI
jgi:hypothetical protein